MEEKTIVTTEEQENEQEIGLSDIILDVSILLEKANTIDECLFIEDLHNRKLRIDSVIDDTVATEIVYRIMRYNREDKGIEVEKRKPIYLYLNTPGGDFSSGMAIVDIIGLSQTPIYTVNLAQCYSMGAVIFTVGHLRFSLPSANIMYHNSQIETANSLDKIKDTITHIEGMESKVKNLILTNTEIDEKLYAEKERVEWYINATEGKKLEIIDHIVGVDCPLSEVI